MPFPPDTTYASVVELQARTGIPSGTAATYQQQLLNDAAYMVDALTRGVKDGYEAFSPSASEDRIYDDDLTDAIEIDDLIGAPTAVKRGTVTIDPVYYKTYPYNPGKGPVTKILFRLDALINATQVATSLWYGHPYRGLGAGMITVTGVWGYCLAADRPPTVKEATLMLAELRYRQESLSLSEIVAMLQTDPTKFLTKPLWDRLSVLRREKGALFV